MTEPHLATPAQIAMPALAQHPLLIGLWQELPDPKTAKLTEEQQSNWIDTAKLVLKLLYSTETARSGAGPTIVPPPAAPRPSQG
jgi:hypothetical protein